MKQTLISISIALFIVAGLLLTNQPASTTRAISVAGVMQSATQAYEAGKFPEAASAYQQLVDQGTKNGELYYNLGNAYFKQGDLGRAILNYRRAARLLPRDSDVQANLTLAFSQTKDQQAQAGGTTISRLTKLAERWLTLNEMAVIALSLWFGVSILLLALSKEHPPRLKEGLQYGVIVTVLALCLSVAALGSRLYEEWTEPAGIVVANAVDVTSGPGKQYTTEFTLHSGTEIKLLEYRGEWVRLALASEGEQLQGWMPTQAVEAVGF